MHGRHNAFSTTSSPYSYSAVPSSHASNNEPPPSAELLRLRREVEELELQAKRDRKKEKEKEKERRWRELQAEHEAEKRRLQAEIDALRELVLKKKEQQQQQQAEAPQHVDETSRGLIELLMKELEEETPEAKKRKKAEEEAESEKVKELKRQLAELEEWKRDTTAHRRSAPPPQGIVGPELASEIDSVEAEIERLEKGEKESLGKQEAILEEERKRLVLKQNSVDLCVLMDCTASMGPWLQVTRDKIVEVIEKVATKEGGFRIRVAFVGYRDIKDSTRFEIEDFTTDVNRIARRVRGISPIGGGDTPEDVCGGLRGAIGLEWKADTKLIIHFTDAPCHGTKYHTFDDDSYPDGDPEGSLPEELLKLIKQSNTDYYFAQINEAATGKMVKAFQDAWGISTNARFRCFDVESNVKNFMPIILLSIKQSVSNSKQLRGMRHNVGSVFGV